MRSINTLAVLCAVCLFTVFSSEFSVAQVPTEVENLQNQLSTSTGGRSSGGLSVAQANGNVSYSYPISSYSVSGYPMNVSLNYCGGVAMTTFYQYLVSTSGTCSGCDGWEQFNENQPAWIISYNGWAVQVLSKNPMFFTRPLPGINTPPDYNWIIDGYDFCNRMNNLSTDYDQDVIKILRGDGGILELRNAHQKKDITPGDEIELYSGYYYSNSVNNKGYGIVTLDSTTWWPEYAKDLAAPSYPERYAYVPRVLKYYPGNGLEYVFREHTMPYSTIPYTQKPTAKGSYPTIFYLEEINSSLRTLVHFKRSRHNFDDPNELPSKGRAQLTEFDGHRFTYGENSLTVEALGRTIEVNVKSKWVGASSLGEINSLKDECVMDEYDDEPYRPFHDQDLNGWLYMATSIRDPEAIRNSSIREAVMFEYERKTTTFKDFLFPNTTIHTSVLPFYRLSRVTEPGGGYATVEYHTGDNIVTPSEVSGSTKKILPDISHVAHYVRKYDKTATLLTQTTYDFDGPSPTPGYDRKVDVSTEDKVSLQSSSQHYYYTFHDFPAYKVNTPQKFMTPNVLFPALDSVVSEAGDVVSTTASVYASNLYTVVGNSGAGRFVWAPTSQRTTTRQGTGATLVTAYNVFSYEFEEVNDFDGNDSLRVLFGYALKKRTTETRNPADTTETLMKGRSEYLNLPMLTQTVTRTDSIYNEEASRLATAAARRNGQQKTVLVFDVVPRTAEVMNIPPLYGLLENSYAIDPPSGDIIAGTENEYQTSFSTNASPVAPRGGLLISYRLGQNGKRIKTGEVQYAGGWYRNVPRSGLNVFGAKNSAFLDYAEAPSLAGNTNNYPTGTKVYNTDATTTETLYDVHHLFEAPLAAEQYVRYWNPTTSLEETRTLAAYTQRTFHGQVASGVDANGWYSAAEYDLNGRSKFVRLPFDFPEPSSCVEEREEKIFERATAMVQRTDTLDCDSLTTRVGISASVVVTPHRLFAGHMVQAPDSCAEPYGKPFFVQQHTGTMIYTAGSSDVVHSASSVTEAALRLKPVAVSRDGCATLRIDLRELGYSTYYTFSCPPLDSLHPDSSGATTPLNIDLMPVWSSLHSMAANTKLHIDIGMETPGAWIEFATYADDVLPALVINGTFSNCNKNDFTYAFRYDDLDLETRTFAKVDDNLHTTTPSWAQTWGDHDGRYSGSKDIFRSDGGVVETQLMVDHPDSPTRVDAAEFSLSGFGMALAATNPLGDVVGAEYDDLGRVTEVTNTDNTTVTAAYDFNTPSSYGLTGQEFYGVCYRTITTDETSKQSVEYRDAFGRVLRTVADYGTGGGYLNATTKYNYDAWGRLVEVIAPNGVTTEYFYDDFHRIKRTEHPDAGTVSYAYDDAGNVRFTQTQEQADDDQLLFTEYDDLGRPTVIGEAKLKGMEGEDLQGGDAGIGRLTELLDPNILHNGGDDRSPYTYNPTLWEIPEVSVASIWGGGSLSTTACLPVASAELQEETTPVGPYMVHPAVYYEATTIANVTDREFENLGAYPKHVLTAMQYDELPVVQGVVWENIPDASVWDDLTPKGEVRNLKGRPAAVAYREHNGEPFHYVVTSYDERGRVEALLRYTENLGYDAVYYTYNSANQILSVRVCDPLRQYATWYGYDANGRMNKMWTSLGANGTGLGTGTPSYPAPLTKPNQEDMQYTYDQMGRVEQMRYVPEDVLTHYRYNGRSWLDSMFAIDASSPSDTVFKQRLFRDARGHITGQRSLQFGQSARVESYVYDGLDQLVEWNPGGSTVSYGYDIVGNRTSDNEPGTSRSYVYNMTRPNRLDQMTAGSKKTDYIYDANGAMTEKLLADDMTILLHHKLTYTQGGLVRQFEDILPIPVFLSCPAAGATLTANRRDWRYRYSASGEREQKRLYTSDHGDACGQTHAWTYYLLGAGDEQLAVYNGRQTNEDDACENTGRRVHMYAVEYISAGGVASVVTRPDGTKELNLRDHLGSVRTVVKAGLTLAQYDYKPFGKVDWSVGGVKREGYIGKEEDRESLLGDYGVRKYDADIGRFLSVDKLFEQQPGYSPYHYAGNDPLNGSDGSGLFMQTEMVRSSILLGADYDPTGDGGGGGGGYGTWSVPNTDGFIHPLFGGPLGGEVFGPVGNMQVFVTGTITVYGNRTRIEQQIDGWIGSGREYMAPTRTSNMGNGSVGGYSGPIGPADGGWSISSYEKPGSSYVRELPFVGSLIDAGWVAAQSLTRVSTPTHIDGTLVEGQERMEAFVEVSSTFMGVKAAKLMGETTTFAKVVRSFRKNILSVAKNRDGGTVVTLFKRIQYVGKRFSRFGDQMGYTRSIKYYSSKINDWVHWKDW